MHCFAHQLIVNLLKFIWYIVLTGCPLALLQYQFLLHGGVDGILTLLLDGATFRSKVSYGLFPYTNLCVIIGYGVALVDL